MLVLLSCDDSQLQMKNVEKNQKVGKSVKKSEKFETSYINLEKYGSFFELRTSTEKSVMLETLGGDC